LSCTTPPIRLQSVDRLNYAVYLYDNILSNYHCSYKNTWLGLRLHVSDLIMSILRQQIRNGLLHVKIRPMHQYTLILLYSHCYSLHVSAVKGPSSGSTDTFCEQGQQNKCPDVNIRLNSSSVRYHVTQLPRNVQ